MCVLRSPFPLVLRWCLVRGVLLLLCGDSFRGEKPHPLWAEVSALCRAPLPTVVSPMS